MFYKRVRVFGGGVHTVVYIWYYCNFYILTSKIFTFTQVSDAIEKHFANLIDRVLVNDELHAAYRDLLEVIENVRNKPQWIAASWG